MMSKVPPPCDQEVFQNGEFIAALDARMNAAEEWVLRIANASGQRVDWHYSGGIAQVLFIGDRAKVEAAIDKLEDTLDGRIMRRFGAGAGGLYRGGVTPLPDGVIGVSNT